MLDFLKFTLIATFVSGLLVLYKDEITSIVTRVINLIESKSNYYNSKADSLKFNKTIETDKHNLEKFITLEVKFEKEMQYLIKEFLISKIEPFFDVPKSDNISEININKMREDFIDFVISYVKMNKMIRSYIDMVFDNKEGFIYYLILRFDSDIYEKYILDKIVVENAPISIKK